MMRMIQPIMQASRARPSRQRCRDIVTGEWALQLAQPG